jgi:hypothetical protein
LWISPVGSVEMRSRMARATDRSNDICVSERLKKDDQRYHLGIAKEADDILNNLLFRGLPAVSHRIISTHR